MKLKKKLKKNLSWLEIAEKQIFCCPIFLNREWSTILLNAQVRWEHQRLPGL